MDENKMQQKSKAALKKAKQRANYSEDRKIEENEKAADRMAKLRKSRSAKVPDTYRIACNNEEIMLGNIIVPPLEDTEDAIGPMNVICPHCGARKFKGEPPSTC